MKNIYIILGSIISFSTFFIWFFVAINTWDTSLPNNGVPVYAISVFYSGYFISVSLFLHVLFLMTKKFVRFLAFTLSNFFAFIMIAYILDWSFSILVGLNKITGSLIIIFLSCVFYYLFFVRSR